MNECILSNENIIILSDNHQMINEKSKYILTSKKISQNKKKLHHQFHKPKNS